MTSESAASDLHGGARDAPRWLSPRYACALLGVNQSTVRRWADAGQIRSFRTPGGHRRLAEADLLAMTAGARPALEAAAVNRIRRQLDGRRDPEWYSAIEKGERDALRPLGRRLVELVSDFLERRRPRAVVEQEVDEIGRSYGAMLHDSGTSLSAAIEGFTFFRKSLDETAKSLAERSGLTIEEASRAREEIAGLADRVLIGVAGAYDAPRSVNSMPRGGKLAHPRQAR
ncbi:MAG: helix-turn-helix domain-containing protein [Dehalococcoidia bacterium]|nr:helix-turn-helix domain-containing protein [Dehalococcoidia bacterium]